MSWLFTSGGQSIEASASASVFPINIQNLAFLMVQLSHQYMTTGKTIALTITTFVSKVMSLLLIMLSRFVIAFLPRSKRLLSPWLQSPSAMIMFKIYPFCVTFLCKQKESSVHLLIFESL